MKIKLHKHAEVGVSYSELDYGKIVLDIESQEAENVLSGVLEHEGLEPLFKILNDDDIAELKGFIAEYEKETK